MDSVEIALSRIQKRIKHGGHGIPEEAVKNRYKSSFKNFTQVFPHCDLIEIYDNTSEITLVAKFWKGNLVYKSRTLPDWIKKNEIFKDLLEFYF